MGPCAQVCEHIVIPSIRLRDDMEEMFEMNWLEYVRRDTEGSDNDTRRRAATDLVKALTARFEAQVRAAPWGTENVSGHAFLRCVAHAQSDCRDISATRGSCLRPVTGSSGQSVEVCAIEAEDLMTGHCCP